MKVTIKNIEKDTECWDLVLMYEKVCRINSGLVSCLSRKGYWVEGYHNATGGGFYEMDEIEPLQKIELWLGDVKLQDENLDTWTENYFIQNINLDTEIEFDEEGQICFEGLLFEPYIGYRVEDMYKGGVGYNEHIHQSGEITEITDEYFVITPDNENVRELHVYKKSWHNF